jgi:hypothetical protein
MVSLAERVPGPGEAHLFGWYLGFAIAVVVIAVVVARVARSWSSPHGSPVRFHRSTGPCNQSYRNMLPSAALRQTIDHAEVILGGLERGRARLGG